MLGNIQFTPKNSRKRKGRGIAAGQGKTAGRGTKGQGARSGANLRSTFEGGQTPLVQRLPKLKGFKSLQPATQEVQVHELAKIKNKTVDHDSLKQAGLIADVRRPIKIIGNAQLDSSKNVTTQAVSAGALKAIEKAGGSVTIKALHIAKESSGKIDK